MSTDHPPMVLDAAASHSLPLSGVKLIEASAGTGKTHAIVNLYLRYVLAGHPVHRILVVTFTNAATEELRGRVRDRLYHALQVFQRLEAGQATQAGDDAFLDRLVKEYRDTGDRLVTTIDALRLAVRSMDEAAIHTIHGFCQRALTDHAFESGQAYDMTLVRDDTRLWDEALKDWWRRRAYALEAPERALFIRALRGIEAFKARQKPLRSHAERHWLPESETGLDALYGRWRELLAELPALARSWRQRRDELGEILLGSSALSRAKSSPFNQDNLELRLAELDEAFDAEWFADIPGALDLLCVSRLDEGCTPKRRGSDPDLADTFFQECERLMTACRYLKQSFVVSALRDASTFCATRVEAHKQQQRLMSFSDQLVRLRDALVGPRGGRLADALRTAFPVVMIDEFQDTDHIQYQIFRQLYFGDRQAADESGDTALIMIGDPKQAIYSFRGGDIFTYMQARHDAAPNLYTLDTNRRSVPGLVEAVNAVFAHRSQAFIHERAIEFQPVRAAAGTDQQALIEQGREPAPLTIWRIPRDDNGKPLSREKAEIRLNASVAGEIARLLDGAQRGDVTLGEAVLRPGDIAVLVRTRSQGEALRRELADHGIRAVSVSTDPVFASEQGEGLMRLLRGVVHCSDRKVLREALASNLLGRDHRDLAATIEAERPWLAYRDTMAGLHRLWQQQGFMVMFQAMMQELGVGERLAQRRDGERALTNVLHLAELLQQNARSHPGMGALLAWYQRQLDEGGDEEAELRLESDEHLVKIATIHASKGLQYPVVFVPYMSACRPIDRDQEGPLAFHDSRGNGCVDLSPEPEESHLYRAEKERLAEDIRLLYVAMTRARAKLYLAWGPYGRGESSSRSALAWLLYPRQRAEDLDNEPPDALANVEDPDQPLEQLASASSGNIVWRMLPESPAAELSPADGSALQLAPAEFTGRIATDWRIASFSALTRDVHQPPLGGSARGDDPIINFPAGSRVGLFLHAILEEIDFRDDLASQAASLHRRHAARFGLDPVVHEPTVVDWIGQIVRTALDDSGWCLEQLTRNQRLEELPFDFAVNRVPIDALNAELSRQAGRALPPLRAEDFRGLITGVIDLVFERDGRYYIADYKSNYLGGALADYAPANLEQAINDRRYDLQYLLYALALHRYLGQRLPGYDYAWHFGGVYYLFLRGMRVAQGPDHGVYFRRPDKGAIETLDALLAPAAAREGRP